MRYCVRRVCSLWPLWQGLAGSEKQEKREIPGGEDERSLSHPVRKLLCTFRIKGPPRVAVLVQVPFRSWSPSSSSFAFASEHECAFQQEKKSFIFVGGFFKLFFKMPALKCSVQPSHGASLP